MFLNKFTLENSFFFILLVSLNCAQFNKEHEKVLYLLDVAAEPANKFAIALPVAVLTALTQNYRSGETSLKVLDETIKAHYHSFIYQLHSPFVHIFDEKLIQMHEAGIIKHLMPLSKRKTTIEELEPQVLTMDHLEIGFLSCLVPMILSGIAFIAENSMRIIKRVLLRC